MTVCSKVMYKL